MAKKDISSIVSGAGLLTSVWTELMAQVKKHGGSDDDIHRLARPEGAETITKLAKLIVGSKSIFSRDMRKEGWTLIEDVSEPEQILISGLEIFSFLKEGEDHISSEEMRSRAKDMGAHLGQRHAEYLLEHQADIPKDWRSFYLVFPGTFWRFPDGYLRVPFLYWNGVRWCLVFLWLGFGWDSSVRFLRVRK